MKIKILPPILLLSIAVSTTWSRTGEADTSLELLHGWTFNENFNGDSERTILTIKTFQPFALGSFFMYYDITGPFALPDDNVVPNEKGGFFGATSLNLSAKKITEKIARKQWNWGALRDLSIHFEVEHVSKFGATTYLGALFDFKVPGFDFISTTVLIRQNWALSGVALQLGASWQITIPLWTITDVVFGGFYQWCIGREGKGVFTVGPDQTGQYKQIPTEGRAFFITQPQLLLDMGKLTRVVDRKFYAGIEYHLAFSLLQKDVNEYVPQLMFKWAI